MSNIYIKRHWDEEDITFYFHFANSWAVRQIEVSATGTVFLSEDEPFSKESMLTDQTLENAEFEEKHIITAAEFEREWSKKEL